MGRVIVMRMFLPAWFWNYCLASKTQLTYCVEELSLHNLPTRHDGGMDLLGCATLTRPTIWTPTINLKYLRAQRVGLGCAYEHFQESLHTTPCRHGLAFVSALIIERSLCQIIHQLVMLFQVTVSTTMVTTMRLVSKEESLAKERRKNLSAPNHSKADMLTSCYLAGTEFLHCARFRCSVHRWSEASSPPFSISHLLMQSPLHYQHLQ